MSARRYTRDHEWLELQGDIGTVGVTAYAQKQLGDVVFVELPVLGRAVARGQEAAVVESVKAASEVFAPVDGQVTEVNEALEGDPALVNSAPEDDGWFYRLRVSDAEQVGQLMDEAAYQAFLGTLA